MKHKSVLLKEIIKGLNIKDQGIYLDATLGSGGHSAEILKSALNVTLIGIDADSDAVERSRRLLEKLPGKKILEVSPNHLLDKVFETHNIEAIDGATFDFGLSSDQLEDSGRGFTFMKDEPLLMTMKKNPGDNDITAREIVNEWGHDSLVAILEGYGEERFAIRIADKILEYRDEQSIETTGQLVEIIKSAVPKFYLWKKINPSTKTFQALRIAVNNEIEHIKTALEKAFVALKPGGRLCIIAFHSVEDRVVKRYFKKLAQEGEALLVTKKPLRPQESEVRENPRSRSAVLRIIEKR